MVSGHARREKLVRPVAVFNPKTDERLGRYHALTEHGELTIKYRGRIISLEERSDIHGSPRFYPKNPDHTGWL